MTKDLEGNLAIEQTDHMVRDGADGLGAVGFAVGLFAPPLLAATAIGAVVGAAGGKALHKKIGQQDRRDGRRDDPDRRRGPDRCVPASAAEQVEPAVARAVQKAIGEAEGHQVKALQAALADAQQKMAEGPRSVSSR